MANSFCIMLSKLHEHVHVKSPGTEHHLKVTLFYSYYDQLGIKQFSSKMEQLLARQEFRKAPNRGILTEAMWMDASMMSSSYNSYNSHTKSNLIGLYSVCIQNGFFFKKGFICCSYMGFPHSVKEMGVPQNLNQSIKSSSFLLI